MKAFLQQMNFTATSSNHHSRAVVDSIAEDGKNFDMQDLDGNDTMGQMTAGDDEVMGTVGAADPSTFNNATLTASEKKRIGKVY